MEKTTVREAMEKEELTRLSPLAAKACFTRGRLSDTQSESDMRTCYQRDTDRIIHSKTFRRLMHKTQVFLQPEGDHYRTRMTHTLEVVRIARTIARALYLNEDLTEAIALGHDLGHTPFGHAGEVALTQAMGVPFRHNEQSLRVVDHLEKEGDGLNLTYETRMGILCHTGSQISETLEGQIVRIADRIAYINHDIDDAMRGGILSNDDIPRDISGVLGESHKERINSMVVDVIEASMESEVIQMNKDIADAMLALRTFMFQRVYHNPKAKGEEDKAKMIITQLYGYYMEHPNKIPADFLPQMDFDGMTRTVCDYIAGMTDKYAIHKYSQIFIPKGWQVL